MAKSFLSTKIGPLYLRPDNIPNGGIVIDDGPRGEIGILFRNLGNEAVTIQVREADALTEAEQVQFQLPDLPTATAPTSSELTNVGATQQIVAKGKVPIVRTITRRFVQIQPTTALLTTLIVYLVHLTDGGIDNAALDVLDDPDLPVRA